MYIRSVNLCKAFTPYLVNQETKAQIPAHIGFVD